MLSIGLFDYGTLTRLHMNISGIRCTVRYQRPASQSRLGLLITFENPNRAICGAASRGAAVLDTSKLEAWYLGLVVLLVQAPIIGVCRS